MLALFPFLAASTPFLFSERWTRTVPESGFSTEAGTLGVMGGRVYFYNEGSDRPFDYGCFHLATGRPIWVRKGPIAEMGRLVVADGFLVADTNREVLQFDPKDGRPVWRAPRAKYRAGPVVQGGRMFYEPKKGTLVAVDLRRHREVWRRTYPFGLTTGFNAARAVGDALVFATDDGGVVQIAPSDGRVVWRRAKVATRISRFLTFPGALVAYGETMVALRLSDGAERWRQPSRDGEPVVRPDGQEIWMASREGTLTRRRTSDGTLIGAAQLAEGEATGFISAPVNYGRGAIVLGQRRIVRLDAQGRLVGSFDTQESMGVMEPVGNDLLCRGNGRILRLTPGAEPLPRNVDALLAKTKRTPREKRDLVRLGRPLVTRLIRASEAARGDAQNDLTELLTQIADRRDTAAMLVIAKRRGVFTERGEGYPAPFGAWLEEKADREQVANAALPKLVATKSLRLREGLLDFVSKGTGKAVVDAMITILRSPGASSEEKGLVYGRIAASGRADVLATIRSIRAQGRRLAHPIAGLSTVKDTDGDGLSDAVDANPLVAPRPLSDAEQAIAAAFDARFRFSGRAEKIGLVDYGTGVRPFELVGWTGGLAPRSQAKALGLNVPEGIRRSYLYPYLRLGFWKPIGQAASVDVARGTAMVDVDDSYGSLSGAGYRATLRKIGGEWYCVDLLGTWEA